jgi:hypothetical protein
MRKSSRKTSKKTSKKAGAASAIAQWGRDVASFRETAGFDVSTPVGFSEYLLSVYGKGVPDEVTKLFDIAEAGRAYGFDAYEDYRRVFETWAISIAPSGFVCARGLHGLGFLPGDDIPGTIFGRNPRKGDGRKKDYDYFSLNIEYSIFHFATQYLDKLYPTVSDLWARAASAIDPDAAKYAGVWVRDRVSKEELAYRDAQAAKRGEARTPAWQEVPKRTKDAILASQCPVLIVAHVDAGDMKGWGSDSESGETMEAEVYVKHCEPDCIEKLFVASSGRGLGTPVKADERRYYGLDEHLVVKGKAYSYFDAPNLLLHPDTQAKGRLVKNLPDGWKWYEVPVR